jgi:hypothetical protein
LARLGKISGVRWIETLRFQRRDVGGVPPHPGQIRIASNEVARLGTPGPSGNHEGLKFILEIAE